LAKLRYYVGIPNLSPEENVTNIDTIDNCYNKLKDVDWFGKSEDLDEYMDPFVRSLLEHLDQDRWFYLYEHKTLEVIGLTLASKISKREGVIEIPRSLYTNMGVKDILCNFSQVSSNDRKSFSWEIFIIFNRQEKNLEGNSDLESCTSDGLPDQLLDIDSERSDTTMTLVSRSRKRALSKVITPKKDTSVLVEDLNTFPYLDTNQPGPSIQPEVQLLESPVQLKEIKPKQRIESSPPLRRSKRRTRRKVLD
jgi:hypothetical protein